jgi:hypothetical protein
MGVAGIENQKIRNRAYNQKLKLKVMDGYGNKCNCCGEAKIEFLTIDHVNNDGAKDKKNDRSYSTYRLCRRIIKENFPNNYQILCFNCNCGRQVNGGICPHKLSL